MGASEELERYIENNKTRGLERERERERCIGRYTESDVTIGIFNTGRKIESDVNYWDICTGRKMWLRYIGKEICVTK